MQNKVKHSLMKLTLISSFGLILMLPSNWAGNVGRQRRVQTSATAAGPALPHLFGSHLWYTTFDTNDEYVETPFQRRAANVQQQQQQQPKSLYSNIYADEQLQQQHQQQQQQQQQQHLISEPDVERSLNFGDVGSKSSAELTPAQVQQLLLFNTPRVIENGNTRQSFEPRLFHSVFLRNALFPNNSAERNVNNNINNVTVINPPAAAAAAAAFRLVPAQDFRSPQLMSYFQTRQGQDAAQGLRLPYELIDLYGGIGGGLSYANNVASTNAGNGINGIQSISGLGAGVPLVPVTLGNNAVGYVPLNLRMFRQLQQAAQPMQENSNEDDAATATPIVMSANEQNLLEPESIESNDGNVEEAALAPAVAVAAAVAPEDHTQGSRFQMFAQRFRQRPVNDAFAYPMRNNPLMTFAKNMRRVQYV